MNNKTGRSSKLKGIRAEIEQLRGVVRELHEFAVRMSNTQTSLYRDMQTLATVGLLCGKGALGDTLTEDEAKALREYVGEPTPAGEE